jgi:hypothetical protein
MDMDQPDKKAGWQGASLRARRRGEPESAGWQAAARRGLRALPGLGQSHDQPLGHQPRVGDGFNYSEFLNNW